MDLQADIKWIHKELDQVTDSTLIAEIKNILANRKSVVPDRISIEQYNQEIDEALEDVKAGRVHSHEEVREIMEQWKEK